MGDVQGLVSDVVAYSLKHPDTEWDQVAEGMRREEIAAILIEAGAKTRKQALRAVQAKLDALVLA